MTELNNLLQSAISHTEQQKNQAMAKKRREQENARKLNLRRQIIIGELVCKHFPAVLKYQPQSSKEESEIEFTPLENTIKWLAEHRTLIENLMKKE